jgi:Site-specific recombinase XerD
MSWVGEGVPDSIVLPTRDGRSRDSSIDPDRVAAILDDLDQYAYASLDHVILALMWTCSMRIGAVRALDVCDVHTDEQWIDMVHRPGTDTPLKNKGGSEREINLHGWVAELLDAWMTDRRPGVRDAHGRDPLLVSDHGRLARSSIRSRVYRLTSCSDLSEACDCGDAPTACDDVVSPHDIRQSSISAWLDEGHDPQLLSGRVDTSPETMDRHYDVRNATDKRELRRVRHVIN